MSFMCPKCRSEKVVEGKHFNLMSGGIFNLITGWNMLYFKPKELRFLCNRSHIHIKSSVFRACTDCGLLWSEIDAEKLRALLIENGNKSVKARLAL